MTAQSIGNYLMLAYQLFNVAMLIRPVAIVLRKRRLGVSPAGKFFEQTAAHAVR